MSQHTEEGNPFPLTRRELGGSFQRGLAAGINLTLILPGRQRDGSARTP